MQILFLHTLLGCLPTSLSFPLTQIPPTQRDVPNTLVCGSAAILH